MSSRDEVASGEESWRAFCGARLVIREALGPSSGRSRASWAVSGPPKGRRLGRASAARAEPADTCGRRARARARGRASQARPGSAAPAAARACLPAHVGVIFKQNVVLAAQRSGGRVGPPSPAGGRGGARATASTSEA